MDLSFLLPGDLSLPVTFALFGVSFIASMLTAALSLGGGTLMMAVLAVLFPPAIVIPLHGAIQLGSNAGRATIQRAHIQWPIVVWISAGALIGSLIGLQFVSIIPEDLFKIIIALFILVTIWLPQPKITGRGPVPNLIAGIAFGISNMIVGLVGPLVMAFIRYIPDRRQLVATHAATLSIIASARVLGYAAIGFLFWEYMPFIAGMILAGLLGTMIGSRLLNRLPEHTFRLGLRLIVTFLAFSVLWEALR